MSELGTDALILSFLQVDGDDSPPTSALETAIDQNALHFLSSSEAQNVVDNLWNGDWVQTNNENDDIDYVQYDKNRIHSFWDHINPVRLGVPRYMNIVSNHPAFPVLTPDLYRL